MHNTCGSCSSCMAAKDSDTEPAARRSAFLTACIARFSLADFFFLLEFVPCDQQQLLFSGLHAICHV